jgi:hypothetical protein
MDGPQRAAERMQEAARYLARSTRNLDRPSDIHLILGSLLDTQRSIAQTLRQLAEWHRTAAAGTHYARPHDESARGVMTTVTELDLAAQEADALQETLTRAHGGSSVVSWLDSEEPDTPDPDEDR